MENRSLLIENESTTSNTEEEFRHYLIAQRRRNVKQVVLCARRYGHILQTNDASELLLISGTMRHHAMEGLTALAKFQGRYDQWKQIKERYQLKWSDKDGLEVFMSIIDAKKDYSSMIKWLQDVCQKIPIGYANILIYATLVGLRPTEACQSISLIHTDLGIYLNKDLMVLEHLRYPDIFIRNSKKAFVSIVNEDIISYAKNANNCGYNALRNFLKRHKLDMQMSYCRKIFGRYLRMQAIESETIDLLQGRIPKSVFARHYFRPDFDEQCRKIRPKLTALCRVIRA